MILADTEIGDGFMDGAESLERTLIAAAASLNQYLAA
jgi:hypothetical protein